MTNPTLCPPEVAEGVEEIIGLAEAAEERIKRENKKKNNPVKVLVDILNNKNNRKDNSKNAAPI